MLVPQMADFPLPSPSGSFDCVSAEAPAGNGAWNAENHLDEQRLPLIPSELLNEHTVNEPGDPRYRAAARMLQSLWRADHNLPIGPCVAEDGTVRDLGSRLARQDAKKGANFLSPDLARLARYESGVLRARNPHPAERLWANMLSSQALCFNLFGDLKRDREKASRVFRGIWPEVIDSVDAVLFEHSPGRGADRFTADYTAFEFSARRRMGAVRRQVKYTESMTEHLAPHRSRYDELSEASGVFKDGRSLCLRAMHLQQLWREHLLTRAMLREGLYDVGVFVVAHPERNLQARDAVAAYEKELASGSPFESGFCSVTIERLLEARRADGDVAFADAFRARYLDIERVEKRSATLRAPKRLWGHA